jgi:hypothetical protein
MLATLPCARAHCSDYHSWFQGGARGDRDHHIGNETRETPF